MESSQEEAQRLRKLEIAARLEENCKSITYANEILERIRNATREE